MIEFSKDEAMQKKWKTFIKKINTKTDDFETVLKMINAFLSKPIIATIDGKDFIL